MSPDNTQSQQVAPQLPVPGPVQPAMQQHPVNPQPILPSQVSPALPMAGAVPTAPTAAEEHAADQVNRLIAQYGNDPYRLSEAISKLRSSYVSEQYHITPGHGEGE